MASVSEASPFFAFFAFLRFFRLPGSSSMAAVSATCCTSARGSSSSSRPSSRPSGGLSARGARVRSVALSGRRRDGAWMGDRLRRGEGLSCTPMSDASCSRTVSLALSSWLSASSESHRDTSSERAATFARRRSFSEWTSPLRSAATVMDANLACNSRVLVSKPSASATSTLKDATLALNSSHSAARDSQCSCKCSCSMARSVSRDLKDRFPSTMAMELRGARG
mmetsp:Transcript_16944/g.45961  ORF Transcript_16944/g.45961 Transcript_16944/m.45961 type:complete len:224 (+) Transcript_16944:777-1448(+)